MQIIIWVLDYLDQNLLKAIVYAVWPQTAHLRPKVRHVVDVLVEMGKQGTLGAVY